MADHLDHFSAMNTFIKSADYLSKPVKKRASSNAFGISRRKDYTSEEKLFFVNLVVEGGNSKASVAKQYDIPESTLRGWCKPKHKDKLEKEAIERKTAPNVFDTPSPSSSSSSAGSGVTPATLFHQYKDSPYDHHHGISSSGIVPTLQIPKVESLYYPHGTALRCRSNLSEPRPLIKEEREEEVLNLSNKTEHHLSSPILTQCLNNIPTSVSESPSNSIKSIQHMKHALLDIKSPNNLIDIHQNISTMFQSYTKSPHTEPSCKLSPKPSNSPSPVSYNQDKPDESNKRKYDAFLNDVNKDVNSPLDLYRKDSQINNNNEFYKNFEQFLSNKRASDIQKELNSSPNKPESSASPVNHYFKNYLESMVKAQQHKLPGTPGGQDQFKLAAQQLWLQQLALNQLAAGQQPNAMQTAAALQQQQLLYERQLLNSRLNQQAATGGSTVHPEQKLYTWTSQLHANQRELEEKLKLLIQTQQQILKDKSQSPPESQHLTISPDTDRVKRMRTMNVRDILENHRQSLEKSHEDLRRPSEDSDISDRSRELSRSEEKLDQLPCDLSQKDEMCVATIEEDAKELLDLSKAHPLITPRDFARSSPLSRLGESPKDNGNYESYSNVEETERRSPYHKPVDHDDNLDIAIHHGEQFLEDLEKVSHPKLTLQHIRQLRDLLCKLKTPVFENNNMKDVDDGNKSKRKSLLNIVHNLTN